MSKIILTILCFILTVNGQYSVGKNEVCKQQAQQISKTLTTNNPLFQSIKRAELGDGIVQPWMNRMKLSNVKRADAVVSFEYQGQEIKLGMREINFYNRYYYYGSDTGIKIISNDTNSLANELKLPFFNKALEVISTSKIKNNSCGRLYLHLLDDACLPIIYTTETVELGCSQQELKD